jgi:hypothetical protein
MRVRFVLCSSGLAALASVAGADEGVPRLLLDLSLRSQPVRLLSIDMQHLTYLDSRGQMRTEGLDRYVALLPAPGGPPGAGVPGAEETRTPTTTVDLADGQRFAGHPTGRADEEFLEWKNPDFGELGIMPIPLEAVRRITLGPSARTPADDAGARDLLVLVNGDTLDGFVESIGDPTRIERDSAPVDVPLERIAEIRLGGPSVSPSGVMVWLASGSVARVASLSTRSPAQLTIILSPLGDAGGTESLSAETPPDRLLAAGFDMSRLVPLGSIPPARQSGSPDRVFTQPVRVGGAPGAVLGAPDIELPGPMSVSWTLPAGASRLGGVAELPEDSRAWGDCFLVMTVGSGDRAHEVFRTELSGAAPRAEFNVELPAAGPAPALTVTVDAGPYGPIQDRVVLKRAVLLLTPPAR